MTGDRPLDILPRSARVEARMSQAELASRAGVTRQAISAVETGKAVPTTPVARGLAFSPRARVCFDLAIPLSLADHLSIQALLETLRSPLFRLELEALGHYDLSALGREVSAA